MSATVAGAARRWRRRSLGARVADIAIAAFLALMAIAIAVNTVADVRTTRRMAIDAPIFARFLAAHPAQGPYSQPTIKVHHRTDLACAYQRRSNPQAPPGAGWCIEVRSQPESSHQIVLAYPCRQTPFPTRADPHPAWPALAPGWRYCPGHA